MATVIAVAATAWVLSGQIGAKEKPAARKPATETATPLPQVRIAWVSAENRHAALVVNGATAAVRKVELRAETIGRVIAVAAEKGAAVAKGDVIVRLAIDDREARLAEAKSLVRQRQMEAEAARQLQQKGFRPDTVLAANEAALEAARAQLARIEVDIARTTLRAPFAGVLDRRPAEIGTYVKEGDLIATLVDLDPILIVAQVSERDIGKLALGGAGQARLITGETVDGTIRYIAAAADAATRTFRVELAVPNPDRWLADGVTAQLRLPLPAARAHRVSPAMLSLGEDGSVGVKSVNSSDIVEFHPVSIVGDGAEGVWLTGLPGRVRLITVGQEFVKPGQRVQPVEAAPHMAQRP
jgi:multidrug efflux system membrane fusion protein